MNSSKKSFPMVHFRNGECVISKCITAKKDEVWKILVDTRCWSSWGPSVKAVECSHRYVESGSRGRVKTALGFWVPFTITSCKNRSYWHWKIGSFSATGHGVEELDNSRCRISFSMVWWLFPYGIVCYIALRRIARMCDHHIMCK